MKCTGKTLWQLFATFFKIGLFTFGGGYAMISVIESETVDKHGWCTKEDIMDMIVIAESTPGIVAINSATFVGFKQGGILGGVIATLGVVLPSFLIISGLYFLIDAFLANKLVAAAFKGVRACVGVLIFKAVLTLSGQMKKDVYGYIACVAAFVLATFTKVDVILIILAGAVAGLIISLIDRNKSNKKPVEINEDGGENV